MTVTSTGQRGLGRAMNRVSEHEIAAVSAAYNERVRAVCHGAFPDALQLSGRLDPARWVLEWNFGHWVGSALGVTGEIADQVTLSNVLILASVVWQDDLADGELPVTDVAAALSVGEGLFRSAMQPYRELLPADSPFWRQVDRWMEMWRTTTSKASVPATDADGTTIGMSALATRGVPLKIPAYGLCLLADRGDSFPALERSIDHAMAGLVLYDHFVDWQEDLTGGRWNAFVSFATNGRPPGRAAVVRTDVEAAMLSRPVVGDYFAFLVAELQVAASSAADVGVQDMATHLAGLAADLCDEGESLATRYNTLGKRATQLMFGNQPVTA